MWYWLNYQCRSCIIFYILFSYYSIAKYLVNNAKILPENHKHTMWKYVEGNPLLPLGNNIWFIHLLRSYICIISMSTWQYTCLRDWCETLFHTVLYAMNHLHLCINVMPFLTMLLNLPNHTHYASSEVWVFMLPRFLLFVMPHPWNAGL